MKTTDNFTFWDIILAEYNFTDNSNSKLRPVLVLFKDWKDITVLKITSQKQNLDDFTISLEPDEENKIKIISYLKIKKITTFHESLFLGKKIWNISQKQKIFLKEKLSNFFINL
jgi:hypothetical protein